RFPTSVGFVNAFGQTETTSTLTILGPEDHRLVGTAAEIEQRTKRLTSIGRPLPDVEVQIVGEDGATLGPGEVGEIYVRTPRVMKGYAGGTESPLRDGWLPTRDMGWRDEEGYLFIAGRKDDMIIRGGENIAPAEVEAILQSHPGVEEAAVVGLTDLEWGQRVAAPDSLTARGSAIRAAGRCGVADARPPRRREPSRSGGPGGTRRRLRGGGGGAGSSRRGARRPRAAVLGGSAPRLPVAGGGMARRCGGGRRAQQARDCGPSGGRPRVGARARARLGSPPLGAP